jgi:hypothetical protein
MAILAASFVAGCRGPDASAAPTAAIEGEDAEPEPATRRQTLRVEILVDSDGDAAKTRVGPQTFDTIAELEARSRSEYALAKENGGELAVELAATQDVPWNVVMQVVHACKRVGVRDVEFLLSW